LSENKTESDSLVGASRTVIRLTLSLRYCPRFEAEKAYFLKKPAFWLGLLHYCTAIPCEPIRKYGKTNKEMRQNQ
jgi:hypothetical protein